MKFHKEITSKENPIYDVDVAEELYQEKKYSHRQLSMMKQENIRVALQNKKYTLKDIKIALKQECGYCFKTDSCWDCMLYKKFDMHCSELDEWDKMMDSKTKKEFGIHHKAWCKKLGIWDKRWE